MRDRRSGPMIHVASGGGLSPTPYFATYGATKAFVIAFSEALGEELRPYGVRSLNLCPGATESEFEKVSNFRGTRPPRIGFETSKDVAETAVQALNGSKSLVISGRHNQLMACAIRIMPQAMSLRMAARSMKPRSVS